MAEPSRAAGRKTLRGLKAPSAWLQMILASADPTIQKSPIKIDMKTTRRCMITTEFAKFLGLCCGYVDLGFEVVTSR